MARPSGFCSLGYYPKLGGSNGEKKRSNESPQIILKLFLHFLPNIAALMRNYAVIIGKKGGQISLAILLNCLFGLVDEIIGIIGCMGIG
jgi:hypothetical protein